MKEPGAKLKAILADTYTLYLKTQNYHWHVRGPQFKSMHDLFEAQYTELAGAIDELAERIVMLGGHAPATFEAFLALKTIEEGHAHLTATEMVSDLCKSHALLIQNLKMAFNEVTAAHDEVTGELLMVRIGVHEKAHWMLSASMG